MRFVIEGTEEAIKLADKAAKLANELRDVIYNIHALGLAEIKASEENDPAAATTESGKND